MNKTMVAILSVFIIGIVALGSASAFGFFGNPDARANIREAIENKDFDAWKEAMQGQITEENFNEMVTRHSERSKGMQGHGLIREAVENNDYDAYLEATSGQENQLSEENFAKLVEMHNAMQNGDYETASELREELKELGFVPGMGNGMGKGQGMGQGKGQGKGMGMHKMNFGSE